MEKEIKNNIGIEKYERVRKKLTIGEMQSMYEKYQVPEYNYETRKLEIAGIHNFTTSYLLAVIKVYEKEIKELRVKAKGRSSLSRNEEEGRGMIEIRKLSEEEQRSILQKCTKFELVEMLIQSMKNKN